MIRETDSNTFCYLPSKTSISKAAAPITGASPLHLSVSGLRRRCSPELFEALLSQLRGGALLLAMLSYDLRVPTSVVRQIRVRDVDLNARSIVLAEHGYEISGCLLDDLREHLHERLCGYEASIRISKRDQLVFSELDEIDLRRESCRWWAGLMDLADDQDTGNSRIFEWGFALAGRYHLKRASRGDLSLESPLELFDKGPRIVRRGRGGVQISYYLWRARHRLPMRAPTCGRRVRRESHVNHLSKRDAKPRNCGAASMLS